MSKSTPKPILKYRLEPHLFLPEPPVEKQQVRKLFHGRDVELARGLDTLKSGLDIKGNRSAKFDKWPWVLHGESRSGKSHLARRIFTDLPDTDERPQFQIVASGRLDALPVLRVLFEQLRGRFLNRLLDQRLAESPLANPEVRLAKQLVEKIALFAPNAQTVTLGTEQAGTDAADLGIQLGGGTRLAKFIAKFQSSRTEKSSVQLQLRPPSANDLAEVCGIMAETLLRKRLIRHVLILMDNVDLLEGYVSPKQNGREQRSLLAEAIRTLHATPGIDVLVTARSWYAHSQKDLHTLVNLSQAEPLSAATMVGIHERRWKTYGGKHKAKRFLTPDALAALADDVDGLPGVFLQHLQTAFYQFQAEEGWEPREYDWLLGVFRRHVDSLRDKCSTGYAVMEAAVRANRLTVNVTSGNPFYGTVLDNQYVFQSYYSESTVFISPLMRRVFQPQSPPQPESTP